MKFDNDCDVIVICSKCNRTYVFMELVFYNIPDKCSKYCSMSQYFIGNETKMRLLQYLSVLQ